MSYIIADELRFISSLLAFRHATIRPVPRHDMIYTLWATGRVIWAPPLDILAMPQHA